MDEQRTIERLRSEGYGNVWVYQAGADEVDKEHDHEYDTKLVILAGAIQITTVIAGAVTSTQYGAGAEIVIPRNVLHSAKVSTEGCRYVIAERR